MAEKNKNSKQKWLRRSAIAVVGLVVVGVLVALYVDYAFPETRCEAVDHLNTSGEAKDCYECHQKSTPEVAQDWLESKHGVMLVKCFVCHGQPDGEGSVPWAVNPDPEITCAKCHDSSMKKMEEKYGVETSCNTCHPFHNNSLHHEAYERTAAKTTF